MKYHSKRCGIVDVSFGSDVTVVEPVNLYGCTVGHKSFIGPFVEIQAGVTIGSHCRIQSHSFICSGVTIRDHVFVSHGVMFVNDAFRVGHRAMGDASLYETTTIESGVCIGTNATIMPVRISEGVVIGAGAVVTKDLLVKGVYAGNPARLVREI